MANETEERPRQTLVAAFSSPPLYSKRVFCIIVDFGFELPIYDKTESKTYYLS